MKISELIAKLQQAQAEYGDVNVHCLAEETEPYWGSVRSITTGWTPGDATKTVDAVFIEAAHSDETGQI